MSAVGRLVNVIIEPKQAFADIVKRPGWWVPMILLMVLSVAFMIAFSNRVGWERFMRHQFETNKQTQNMPVEQRENLIQMQAKYAGPIGTVMAVVMVPVSMLVIAGVMMFIFTTVLGGSVNFKQSLGVVSHSMMPGVISTPLILAVMYMKDPSDFDLNNPAGFNLGFYMDPLSTPAWLVTLGSSIDLFVIWMILLIATGMSVATRKPWKTSLMAVALPWLLIVLIKVGWSAFRG